LTQSEKISGWLDFLDEFVRKKGRTVRVRGDDVGPDKQQTIGPTVTAFVSMQEARTSKLGKTHDRASSSDKSTTDNRFGDAVRY